MDDLLALPHLSVEDAQELCQQRRRLGRFQNTQEALSLLPLPPHALMEISRLVMVENPAAPRPAAPKTPPPQTFQPPPPEVPDPGATHGLGHRLLDL